MWELTRKCHMTNYVWAPQIWYLSLRIRRNLKSKLRYGISNVVSDFISILFQIECAEGWDENEAEEFTSVSLITMKHWSRAKCRWCAGCSDGIHTFPNLCVRVPSVVWQICWGFIFKFSRQWSDNNPSPQLQISCVFLHCGSAATENLGFDCWTLLQGKLNHLDTVQNLINQTQFWYN